MNPNIKNKLLSVMVKNGSDTFLAERIIENLEKNLEELVLIIHYKENQSLFIFDDRCIYCHKTSKESGRAMFMINTSGTYWQCYPELCPENKEKWLEDENLIFHQ